MLELTDIRMPHMGSVEFARLTEWLIKPGEAVAEGEPLCEVSTDKVDTEVESPCAGILVEYVAEVDQEVPVGDVIARFAPPDSPAEAVARAVARIDGVRAEEPAGEPVPTAPTAPPTAPETAGVAAASTAIDPADTHQTPGLSTPPTDSLVLAAAWFPHVNHPPRGARRGAPDASGNPAPVRSAATAPSTPVTVPLGYEAVAHEAIEHSRLRRAIARNLTETWTTVPQLTAQIDVDFTAVSVARAKINRARLARGQAKLSYLPFVAVALCRAVAAHPVINATFTETHLLRWRTVNLGIAVDTPEGLLVPVIREAQHLTLESLAEAIAAISTAAATGGSRPEDLAGGTITISNSGSVGGVVSTPILTAPQVASLGVPAIVRTPVARPSADGRSELLTIRSIARLGLSFDHRAFDGAQALRALDHIRDTLERWPAEDRP
ncbi:dihydrolipoamide acetyltransferase family protein [Nocardia farcinica]|uniref:dihydrolipoamide acetyltransferase family protein n=2 Tax=Nocardia farcinica TaxID=37329 RepID=UPI0015F03635|nr:dihydrolipoamide acetyltransferase family protein [Nocardia farcinica]MBA4854154.1 2-oxo acid dehydrogenase subunit E2 [Nocardia farcinica]MBC9814339.1 2-oxo acid dehydrogenase subunit E2 [Nocardia farcinica]